jgi:signal transduction histidine kinase
LPMVMRNRLLGVLLVDNPESGRPITSDNLVSLSNIARQASMVIGSVQLCIDRTQRLAVEEERGRIAMEIHDAISQQLYGITYTLDASVKLLPDHADEVRDRLCYLLPQAQHATAAIRHAIFDLWPNELDAELFGAELRGYAQDIAPTTDLQVRIQLDPHFNALAIGIRRQLYRIAQEALANIITHAQAHHAEITFTAEANELRLMIVDDGQGFDPAGDRLEGSERPHFGLLSMRERAQSLGGSLQIESHPQRGTCITVVLPQVC